MPSTGSCATSSRTPTWPTAPRHAPGREVLLREYFGEPLLVDAQRVTRGRSALLTAAALVGDQRIGDTVELAEAELKVTVTGGQGQVLKVYENGELTSEKTIATSWDELRAQLPERSVW